MNENPIIVRIQVAAVQDKNHSAEVQDIGVACEKNPLFTIHAEALDQLTSSPTYQHVTISPDAKQ